MVDPHMIVDPASNSLLAKGVVDSNVLSHDVHHAGHHISHHLHGRDETEGREGKRISVADEVDPTSFARGEAISNAFKGAALLGMFGTVAYGMTQLAGLIVGGTAATAFSLTALAPLALGGFLTGAVWFGGKAYLEAHNDAKQHNKQVHFFRSMAESLGLGRSKEAVETAHALSKNPVVTIVAPPALAPEPELEAEAKPRPAFLNDILSNGPRSLNPHELAVRIKAERDAAMDHGAA